MYTKPNLVGQGSAGAHVEVATWGGPWPQAKNPQETPQEKKPQDSRRVGPVAGANKTTELLYLTITLSFSTIVKKKTSPVLTSQI